jgi:uncharacterized protein (DUF3084 family)
MARERESEQMQLMNLEAAHHERQRALSEREQLLDAEKRRLDEVSMKLQRKESRLDEEVKKIAVSARNATQLQLEYGFKLEEVASRMEALQQLEADIGVREHKITVEESTAIELSLKLQHQVQELELREKVTRLRKLWLKRLGIDDGTLKLRLCCREKKRFL